MGKISRVPRFVSGEMPGKIKANSYEHALFDPRVFRRLVCRIERKLKTIARCAGRPVKAIVGMGVSGVPLAAAVSFLSGIPFVIVRKPGESSHDTTYRAVGYSIDLRDDYVIIDDFIDSGDTICRIIDEISMDKDRHFPMAIVLYNVLADGYDTEDLFGAVVPIHSVCGKQTSVPYRR